MIIRPYAGRTVPFGDEGRMSNSIRPRVVLQFRWFNFPFGWFNFPSFRFNFPSFRRKPESKYP